MDAHQPGSTKFKIALCQLRVCPDKDQNLVTARNMIKVAAHHHGARLVVLPEMWNCPYSDEYFHKFAEDFGANGSCMSFTLLSEAASCYGITIVGGSMPEREAGQLFNTCCVFGPDGKLMAKHRKMHLFDCDIPGEFYLKESDSLSAGDKLSIVDTDVGRIGVGICHDIRFPELAILYRERGNMNSCSGVELICYPAAFNMSTGESAWELVQRARAVDNQLFVATCSPSRNSSGGSYQIWGHSTVVSPSGEIIATAGEEDTVVVAEVDLSEIKIQRERNPIEKQRRSDIYRLVGVQGKPLD